MSKLMLVISFLILGFLGYVSTTVTDSISIWLSMTSADFNLLRGALMLVVLLLLVTNPPRNRIFRTFVGLTTLYLTVWSLNGTYQNQIGLLDGLSFVITAIAMGVAALEYTPDQEQIISPARKEELRQSNAQTA